LQTQTLEYALLFDVEKKGSVESSESSSRAIEPNYAALSQRSVEGSESSISPAIEPNYAALSQRSVIGSESSSLVVLINTMLGTKVPQSVASEKRGTKDARNSSHELFLSKSEGGCLTCGTIQKVLIWLTRTGKIEDIKKSLSFKLDRRNIDGALGKRSRKVFNRSRRTSTNASALIVSGQVSGQSRRTSTDSSTIAPQTIDVEIDEGKNFRMTRDVIVNAFKMVREDCYCAVAKY